MKPIKAFFYNAQDARRALNALRQSGIESSDPQPLQQPENGRQWALEIEVPSGSVTTLYPSPVLSDRIVTIILDNNGATARA